MYITCPNLIAHGVLPGRLRFLRDYERPIYAEWERAFVAVLGLPEGPKACFFKDLGVGQEFRLTPDGVAYYTTHDGGYAVGPARKPGMDPHTPVIAYPTHLPGV